MFKDNIKSHKKLGFHHTFFKKPQGGQFDPPGILGLKEQLIGKNIYEKFHQKYKINI